jgi:hypothetical protein
LETAPIGALVDAHATVNWGVLPALRRRSGVLLTCFAAPTTTGSSAVELADCERTEQHYLENTAILVTPLYLTATACVRSKSLISRHASASMAGCSGP